MVKAKGNRAGGNGGLPDLPAELRRRPARPADLPAWRAARRRWEVEHGVTVEELWKAEHAAARAFGLPAINALYAPDRCIENEEDDPRSYR